MKLDSNIAAVITGGASGLGAATARALASFGVKVAIFDFNAEKGEALASALGGVFCKVDVTSDAEVDAGFAKSRAALGQERILVNCAGTGNAFKTASRDKATKEIKHFPIDAFNRIIQINLVGTFRCAAKSAAGMLSLEPLDAHGERGQHHALGGQRGLVVLGAVPDRQGLLGEGDLGGDAADLGPETLDHALFVQFHHRRDQGTAGFDLLLGIKGDVR